ncbi:DUF2625 family protein [Streptosporangiaceae bacterium NEAU-GS5]|nr:DUF2625 family protein [Streptosporangiaceae bacterium NEAU-GS5]
MRTLDELLDVEDPAWPELSDELAEAAVPVEILPVDAEQARQVLHRLQVTVRSRLGALALHSGGLLVEQGWLRVLGGGHAALPPLTADETAAGLLVGFDVLGGRFEVNGAAPAKAGRPGAPGEICYFAPDTLQWEELGVGHSTWLSWIVAGRTRTFYASFRWPDWAQEVTPLAPDQGLSFYPSLWSQQAHDDLASTSRRAVPIDELFATQREMAQELRQRPSQPL